jgi:outer membrane protein assembly factor BamD (BamD/ComL family)
MFKKLLLLVSICVACITILSACEQQKQASAAVGAEPKKIMDKATTTIKNAEVLEAEKTKALEEVDAPEDKQK